MNAHCAFFNSELRNVYLICSGVAWCKYSLLTYRKCFMTSATEGEGGYVFTPLCLFVCLCAGYLKMLETDADEILWMCWVCEKEESIQLWWRSGSDNFLSDSSPLRDSAKPIYSMISQKVVDRLGVSQGRIDSISVKIRIRIWIRELFNCQSDSSPFRERTKNDI